MKPPKIDARRLPVSVLNAIADAVLAHKPKPKSKPARKRARRAKKIATASS